MADLKHKDKLLLDIAKGCERLPRADIKSIKVIFVDKSNPLLDDIEYEFSLSDALEAIANDLYWDERGNWIYADTARVETF